MLSVVWSTSSLKKSFGTILLKGNALKKYFIGYIQMKYIHYKKSNLNKKNIALFICTKQYKQANCQFYSKFGNITNNKGTQKISTKFNQPKVYLKY